MYKNAVNSKVQNALKKYDNEYIQNEKAHMFDVDMAPIQANARENQKLGLGKKKMTKKEREMVDLEMSDDMEGGAVPLMLASIIAPIAIPIIYDLAKKAVGFVEGKIKGNGMVVSAGPTISKEEFIKQQTQEAKNINELDGGVRLYKGGALVLDNMEKKRGRKSKMGGAKLIPKDNLPASSMAGGCDCDDMEGYGMVGAKPKVVPKEKKKRVMSDKMKQRAELVKKIMKEEGVSLPEASKIIKERYVLE